MQEALKVKEPASNYDMPIRNRKAAEEQAAKEAEAARVKTAEEAALAEKASKTKSNEAGK